MDIITLGIGPGGNIPDLVLTGLAANSTPPVPTPSPEETGVALGVVTVLSEGVSYALPPRLVTISVLTSAGTIEVSLDGSVWQAMTLDTNFSFLTSAVFIRSVDGDSDVIAKGFTI